MTSVNVATLKSQLSRYLGEVEKGEELLVTSHRRPVARMVPAATPTLALRKSTRPVSDLRTIAATHTPFKNVRAVENLLRDRRSR